MKNLLPIGQAASFLNVSIDTLRRWDKAGKIHSTRIDGKNRFFSIEELKRIKEDKYLTVSEIAKKIGVSASTVRRLETKADFTPQRDQNKSRIYTEQSFSKLLQARESEKLPEKAVHLPKFSLPKLDFTSVGNLTIIILVLTTSLSTLYLRDLYIKNQTQMANSTKKVLGAKDQGGIVGFFSNAGSFLSDTNRRVLSQYKTVFQTIQKTIVEKTVVEKTTQIERLVVDEKLIENLNAELVQGKKPGTEAGDLAYFSSAGIISGLTIPTATILDGSITTAKLDDDAVTSSKIVNGSIVNADIDDGSINSAKIANDTVESGDIKDGTITNSDISDNTISASDITATITFSDGDFLDLAAIVHDDTSPQGLRLPNVSSASPSSPSSGEGYLSYNTSGNQVLVYNGTSWTSIGGSVTLATGSGLEYVSEELTLLTSCTSGQLLKWSGSAWACGDDSGAGGAGISTIEENNADVITSSTRIDFLGTDFAVALDGAGEGNISIDYTNSKIVRSDQSESISGSWTFTGGITANDATADTILIGQSGTTDDTVTIAGNVSITDDNWAIDATGLGTGLTANDLSCTDCIGATEIAESGISSTNFSDGANIAHINADETISGAWTFSSLAVSDTNVTISGGDTTLDVTGAATRTLAILNSTVSQVADLNLSDGSLLTGGTSRLTNAGVLQNITGFTVSSGSVSLPADQIDATEINDNGVTLGVSQDELCLTYENTGGYFEWQTCGSGGSGIATVRESDASPSVGSLTTLEFGPATTSEDEFVVTDQTGGVARVVLGSKVAHINATESISGAWTFSNLTISDTTISLSGGSTAFDMTAGTDTIFDITNAGVGTAKLRIDSLTNAGAGCDTIDTTADGTLICGTDAGGAGGGIATIEENDVSQVTSATVIDFLGTDFVVGAVGAEGNISIDYTNSKIVRSDQTESISGGWTFSNLTISDTNIPLTGGDTTVDITGAATRTLTLLNSTDTQITNFNLSDGNLQVGGSTVIDTSRNVTNIGNITAAAAVTIASTGAGNDVIIDGADILDIQDNTTFAGTVEVTSTFTANGNITLGNAATDQVTVTGEVLGAQPLSFEGTTNNDIYTIFSITDPTVASKTITFPNANITVNAAGDLSGTTLSSGVTGSSLTSVGTLSTLSVTGAISAATSTNTINGIIINSGAVSNVSTLSSSGDWTWTAATPTVTVNTDETFTISDAGGAFNFSVATGPSYTGDARPTKRITLTPEYPGASLTGTGVGTMTSDNDATASSYRNYYNWTSAQGTTQMYSVWIKVPLPSDFDGWTSVSALTVEAWSDSLVNTAIAVTTYDTGNTAACTSVSVEPGSPSAWTDATPTNCTNTGTWAANGIMTVKVDLSSLSNANARAGRIYLEYKAKF